MDPHLNLLQLYREHQYHELKNKNDIRLLQVQDSSGKIKTPELVVFSIDDAPKYEAVSYAWGSKHRMRCLELSTNETVSISSSLFQALPWVIYHSRHEYLWIDQICINQKNIPEKNQQVQIMGEIFKKAERVMAWLGEDHYNAASLDEVLDEIGSEPNASHCCLQPHTPSHGYFDELGEMLLPAATLQRATNPRATFVALTRDYVNAVKDLLKKPWFRRGWVLQEVLLAKSLDFIIGQTSIAFRDFERIYGTLVRLEILHRNSVSLLRSRGYRAFTIMSHDKDWFGEKSSPHDPETCLSFGWFDVTDPRDHAYAFAGLFPGFAVSVDYALPVDAVFINHTNSMIQHSRSLNVLAYSCKSHSEPRGTGASIALPSWVPDFSQIRTPSTVELYTRDDPNGFCASKARCHHFWHAARPTILQVQGRIVDRVTHYLHRPIKFKLWHHPSEDLQNWLSLDWYHQKLLDICAPQSLTRSRLLTVLLGGGANSTREGSPVQYKDSAAWQDYIDQLLLIYDEPCEYPESKSQDYHHEKYSQYRELIRYSEIFFKRSVIKGSLGLGLAPDSAQPGDYIAILHGSGVPIVLRESMPDSAAEYEVVGQCFYENIMQGEAVDWPENGADVFQVQ
ncbi:heterokaryon incompatibility protein-domain-containing protein [Paraphoma chrysanthemicola]|uniref:Heterokaryon incompatibility protein-domain-containing protein n=1 Tax=Paraphoma chrysanthemicola TaxID=798071 RepID=A0A8K0RI27_9PLEO|nr:heterokaryon incompatibility protein-domain-containing protein [Paraphoma chrysanthemicola]